MLSQPDVLLLARTTFRDSRKTFGIRQGDRFYHLYAIGQTGTGKSTLLANLMVQDLKAGRGFAFLDPHGDVVERLSADASEAQRARVVYLNVPDPTCKLGFNPLESVPIDQRPLAASGVIESFENVWGRWWGPRLEHFFRNALLTLLDQPSATLADVPRLFFDDRFRREALHHVTHPVVRDFWLQEYAGMTPRSRVEALAPLQNKLGAFLSQPQLYRILNQEHSSFDLRKVMDEGQVLLVNLSKGQMGSDASSLFGALLVSRLGLAALGRADMPESERRPFFIYLDEFQNFTTLSVATMLSELRKYRVGLILAHQYLHQLAPEVREAVLGNVGTLIAFRVGPEDARLFERYFEGEFSDVDLMNLPNYNVYLRLMIDGAVSRPFSAETLPPNEGSKGWPSSQSSATGTTWSAV